METCTLQQTIKGYSKGWKGLWEHFISLITRYKKLPIHDHIVILSFKHTGYVDNVIIKER